VQKEILEKHPGANVKVYAVWFSMLPGDSRSGWDDCVISDPRVHNLWDQKRLTSQAFAGDVEGAAPPVWDAYLLYGPKSTWKNAAPRPISSGATVIGTHRELENNILRLLN